jgi:hypothetical protein
LRFARTKGKEKGATGRVPGEQETPAPAAQLDATGGIWVRLPAATSDAVVVVVLNDLFLSYLLPDVFLPQTEPPLAV